MEWKSKITQGVGVAPPLKDINNSQIHSPRLVGYSRLWHRVVAPYAMSRLYPPRQGLRIGPLIHCPPTNSPLLFQRYQLSPNFKTFKEPKTRFQGINSASLCSLVSRYDNPIITRFLAPHRSFKNTSTDSSLPPLGQSFWKIKDDIYTHRCNSTAYML